MVAKDDFFVDLDGKTEDFGLPHIVIWVKETPYRSTLRDPRGKAEPTIGAGHCKSSQTRLTQWDSNSVRNIENLERKNREDMILVGVDPETFGHIIGNDMNHGMVQIMPSITYWVLGIYYSLTTITPSTLGIPLTLRG
ncbi:hypothetical protein H8356DRAFT_1331245 [Neocallimastix lanati (nom. inval.)]|nr:hypothetical protein H8356DRAFT_1331245 [Neocallimastix sp. JGI-2020a]